MVLVLAVEQGGREGIEVAALCLLGGCLQTEKIAEPAALILAEGYPAQEPLKVIFVTIDDPDGGVLFVYPNRIQPPLKFLIGMYVRVEKKAYNLPFLAAQSPQRIDEAVSAADMDERLQSSCYFFRAAWAAAIRAMGTR